MNVIKPNLSRTVIRLAFFFVPTGLLLLYEFVRLGQIGNLTADGKLYLSIADHFLATGHFIQNARWFENFVVPPGVPLVLLLLRMLRFTERMITAFQTCLFGFSCLMLGESEKRIFGHYGLSPMVYMLGYMRCRLLLGNILVEHYYLFLLCFLLWLVFRVHTLQRLFWMNAAGLALLLTRPALSPVSCVIMIYTLVIALRSRKFFAAVATLLVPVIVLTANLMVNHRETGEYILLESYSGADLYITACENAPATIKEGLHFADETRDELYYDSGYSMPEISRLLGEKARNYVREHPGEYFLKTLRRFYDLFLKCYGYLTLVPTAGALLLIAYRKRRNERMLHAGLFGLNLFLAVLTSFGIPEIRYTAVIWPLAALHAAAAGHWMIERRMKESGGNDGQSSSADPVL